MNTDTTLAQIDSIRTRLADMPTVTDEMKNAIAERLTQLWNTANAAQDDVSIQAINETWAMVESQAASIHAVSEAAISAADLASRLMEARDQVAEEYAELSAAVENGDRKHWLVDTLIGEVEEDMSEQLFDQAMDYAFDEIHDDIVNQLMESTNQTYRQCSQFYSAIRNGELTDDEMSALLALMDLINLRLEAEFQQRMRAS